MSEPLHTFCECPHCGEMVRASRHSTAECRNTLVRQRDDAREAAIEFFGEMYHMGAYLFFKHYRHESEDRPWLKGHEPFPASEDHYKPKEPA